MARPGMLDAVSDLSETELAVMYFRVAKRAGLENLKEDDVFGCPGFECFLEAVGTARPAAERNRAKVPKEIVIDRDDLQSGTGPVLETVPYLVEIAWPVGFTHGFEHLD